MLTQIIGTTGADFLFGTDGDDLIMGLGGGDYLYGGAGNDILNAGLGSASILAGGTGNDSYVIGSFNFLGGPSAIPNDVIFENEDEGIDTVYTLIPIPRLWDNVENVTVLAGASAAFTIPDVVGNGLDNVMTGNANANVFRGLEGNDTLDGRGGHDILSGGLGDDLLIGGAGGDSIDGGADFDTASYATSSAGVTISLNGGTGTGGDALGDTLVNVERLVGSNFNDTLTGTSMDSDNNSVIDPSTLEGLGGNDTINGGQGNNFIDGGTGNDTILGLGGADRINGGLGNDRLIGGAGSDIFVFNTALNAATNVDTITDFSSPPDTIRLENAIFKGLGAATGVLNAAFFKANATGVATDANDHIIYNTSTGALTYDSNGNHAGGVIKFAVLAAHPHITNADFFVI